MNESGMLLHSKEAIHFAEKIANPITKRLVKMALTHLSIKVGFEKSFAAGDVDMLFLAKGLEEFFSEHEVLLRTLRGEKIGDFFDDE